MSTIKYPLALFEIEEADDRSILVDCKYENLNSALSNISNRAQGPAPLVFMGVAEKWMKRNSPQGALPILSTHILEGVREKLAGDSYSKAIIQLSDPSELVTSNDGKSHTIWLWGPPIAVSLSNGDPELVYICLVNWVSNHSINPSMETIGEFGVKAVFLSICSRICELTYGTESETKLYDYIRFLQDSDYSKKYANIFPDSFLHVFNCKQGTNEFLVGHGFPKGKQISYLDEMGTQFNTIEIAKELADLTKLATKVVYFKKQGPQILNVSNAEDMLRSCVSAANPTFCYEALPPDLISMWDFEENRVHDFEKMDVDDTPEEAVGFPSMALFKTILPAEETKQNHFKTDWANSNVGANDTDRQTNSLNIFENHLDTWVKNLTHLDHISPEIFNILKHKISNKLPDDEVLASFHRQVDKIYEASNGYLNIMAKHFFDSGYLPKETLDQKHQQAMENTLVINSNPSSTTSKYVKLACDQLGKIIQNHNHQILNHQLSLVKELKSEVESMYTKELQRFIVEEGPFPSKLFQKIAQALFGQCMAAFTKSLEYKGQSLKDNDKLKEELDDLAKNLKKLVEKQSKMNNQLAEGNQPRNKEKGKEDQPKIPKTPQEVNKECSKDENLAGVSVETKIRAYEKMGSRKIENENQSSYLEKPKPQDRKVQEPRASRLCSETTTEDDKMALNPANTSRVMIELIVEAHKNRYRQKFKEMINSPNFQINNIRKGHGDIVKSMKAQFETNIRDVTGDPKADVKKIWQTQMHSELEKLYKLHREAKETKRPNKETLKINKKDRQDESNMSTSDDDDDHNDAIKIPLVFQITEKLVGMAVLMNGAPKILQNENNEDWTLNIVGQTNKGDLVYGEMVHAEHGNNRLREKWQIGEMIEKGNTGRIDVFVEHNKIPVRVELLLGFLLKKLKIAAEKKLFQSVNDCIVCIPYFYTSLQRRQIVDSTRVAGFEGVRVINDISALAYEYAVHARKWPPKQLFLVVTESSRNIRDVAFFKYEADTHTGRVQMVSHSSNYHGDNESIKDSFVSTCKYFKSLIVNKAMEHEKQEHRRKACSLIETAMTNYHDKFYHPKSCNNRHTCIDNLQSNFWNASILVCGKEYLEIYKDVTFGMSGVKADVGTNKMTLCGAARLCEPTGKKSGHPVSDLLSSTLWLSYGSSKKVLLEKGEVLSAKARKFHAIIQSNNAVFFQKLSPSTNFEVVRLETKFELNVTSLRKPRQRLRVHFGVKWDGIFCVTKVEVINADTMKKIKMLKEGSDYEIRSLVLSTNEIKDYKRYVVGYFKDN